MKKVRFDAGDGLESLEVEIESFILDKMTFYDKEEYEITEVEGYAPEEVAPLFGGAYGVSKFHLPNSYDAILAGIYAIPFKQSLSAQEISELPDGAVVYGEFGGRMGDENGAFAVFCFDDKVVECRESEEIDKEGYDALLSKLGYKGGLEWEHDENIYNRSYGGFGRVVLTNKSYDIEIDGGHLTLTIGDRKYMFEPWLRGTMVTLINEFKDNRISRGLWSLDPLMGEVRRLEEEQGKVSRSMIQRDMRLGFEISGQLLERYEQEEVENAAE
ncbi:hypothetical protein FWH13_00415 [Candidatus Saccharibacteria bacterium]|nr:hypothetical protein [Candidatus Saccharibacteria bacterium]